MLPYPLQMTELEPPSPGRKKEKHEEELEDADLQLATLAYLPVLCMVSVIAKRREEFVAFHARQGLVLFVLELGAAMLFFLPVIGPAFALALALACLAAAILGIRTVRRRGRWSIPLVGAVAERLHL
jgi:fumarate reductase subunit D